MHTCEWIEETTYADRFDGMSVYVCASCSAVRYEDEEVAE